MMIDLCKSVFFEGKSRRWSMATVLSAAGLALVVGTLYAGTPASALSDSVRDRSDVESSRGSAPAELREVAAMAERVRAVSDAWSQAQAYYETRVAPIERVLLRYRADPALAERVAVALVREANKVGLEPRLLLAVLLVENPWLDPKARSPVGAVGLMQVMPLHRGAWAGCGDDLEDIDGNICYGARIFAHYFRASRGDVERALLRYNGCVRGTNTPNCHQYPYHVFARAGQASVLAWLDTGVGAGSP